MLSRAAPEITPKMVWDLLARCWEEQRASDRNMPSWEEFVADCRVSRAGSQAWRYNVEQLLWLEPDKGPETGLDGSTIRRMQELVLTLFEPPKTSTQSRAEPAGESQTERGRAGAEAVVAKELNLDEC